VTGVVGPMANAGLDRFSSGPVLPQQTYQGVGAVQGAPIVTTGGEGAIEVQRELAQSLSQAATSNVDPTIRGKPKRFSITRRR
jgi:hypothetical protein